MNESYRSNTQAAVLAGLLQSGDSLYCMTPETEDVLQSFNLSDDKNLLVHLLVNEPYSRLCELTANEFLSNVAYELANLLEKMGYPEDTPQEVWNNLQVFLQMKAGRVWDEKEELKQYDTQADGYGHPDKGQLTERINMLEAQYTQTDSLIVQVEARIDRQRTADMERESLINCYTFWQSKGYTADFLYMEGLSDALMISDYLKNVLKEDLSGLDDAPSSCAQLMTRTVRLCNVVDQDGSDEKKYRLARIDKVILKNNFHVPSCEWRFSGLPQNYLNAFMDVRSGILHLNEIDRELADEKLYTCAVHARPDNIRYVPEKYRTKELLDYAIIFGLPENLQFVPGSLLSDDYIDMCINRNPECIRFLNPDRISYDMALSAVMGKAACIRYVNLAGFTGIQQKTLLQLAMAKDHEEVRTLAQEDMYTDMILDCCKSDPTFLSVVPDDCLTPERVLKLLETNPKTGRFIPGSLLADEKFMQKAKEIKNGWEQSLPVRLRTM